MSAAELTRLEIVHRLETKMLTQSEAAEILGLSVRQIKRIWRCYRRHGAAGLISKKRGKPSNNRLKPGTIQQALALLYRHYYDFGPTLAHEKLTERHHLKLSNETVRKLMIAEGLWKPKKAKKAVVHQMRERRACFGELVQIDGSPHDWFEGRSPACTLLVFIDDATGRLVELFFTPSETTYSYWAAMRRYLPRYGKPRAFYSDKNSIFRVNIPGAISGTGLTQFGRSMKELGIEVICANTPQAKGRVENVNGTLQDRLVKEMRLAGISGIEEANSWLPTFMADFNTRFEVVPRSSHDAHRPLHPADNLDRCFTWQETRTLSKNLTLQYKKVIYQIQSKRPTYAMRHTAVMVCENENGEVEILYRGRSLPYSIYHKQARQAQEVTSKSLDNALKKVWKPPADHPWRNNRSSNPKSRLTLSQGDSSTS
jgi:transposase